MSQAGSQAWAFYREVARTRVVWTLCDEVGYPTVTSSGFRAQPFWSSRSRVERIIKTVPAYASFEPEEVSWQKFCSEWVPEFIADNMLVGVNSSGKRAKGYDLAPAELVRNVQALIENPDQ